jgi:glycosyltransferase involved in cell wall biosynthesis
VSDGTGHKNHINLIKAWEYLAHEGIRPSLALTLGVEDRGLISNIINLRNNLDLNITNLGSIPHEEVINSYRKSKALIFPSTSESLGLPLLEAKDLDMDIVASELDFVRDVCDPVETFDPYSSISIARAVKRHIGLPESRAPIHDAKSFLHSLCGCYIENPNSCL